MFGYPTVSQLSKTGPYKQIKVPGIFGETHDIPKENPVDKSFMPRCAQGPCGHYSQRWEGRRRGYVSHCDYYLEPNRVPQKTDWFADSPEKDRKSCSWNLHPVGIFSSDQPTYYVYWDQDPNQVIQQTMGPQVNASKAMGSQVNASKAMGPQVNASKTMGPQNITETAKLQEQLKQMQQQLKELQAFQSKTISSNPTPMPLPNSRQTISSNVKPMPLPNSRQTISSNTTPMPLPTGGKTMRRRQRKQRAQKPF